jgi:hypothetical protein
VDDMQAVIKQLQDTDIVLAAIQERQSRLMKGHGEWLEQHELWIAKHNEAVAKHDLMMIEIEDNLNGLIAVVDDLVRRPKSE